MSHHCVHALGDAINPGIDITHLRRTYNSRPVTIDTPSLVYLLPVYRSILLLWGESSFDRDNWA